MPDMLFSRCAVAIVCLASAFVAAAPGVNASTLHRFGNWAVGCDNTLHCRAVGWARTIDADEPTFLVIDREGGPKGRVRVAGGRGFAPDIDILVDGKPVLKTEADVFDFAADPTDIDTIAPLPFAINVAAATEKLLDAALKGAGLSFAANAEPALVVPLDGLRPALLFIDETQGRAGTVTALVAKGPRPASEVSAAPQAPLAIAPPPPLAESPADKAENDAVVAFHQRHVTSRECDEKSLGARWDITPVRVSARQRIYEYYCRDENSRFLKLLYVVDEDATERIAKAPMEMLDAKGGAPRLVTDMRIAGGHISDGNWVHTREGDKSGDCRETIAWRWDGKAFRLLLHVAAPICQNALGEAVPIPLWRTREN